MVTAGTPLPPPPFLLKIPPAVVGKKVAATALGWCHHLHTQLGPWYPHTCWAGLGQVMAQGPGWGRGSICRSYHAVPPVPQLCWGLELHSSSAQTEAGIGGSVSLHCRGRGCGALVLAGAECSHGASAPGCSEWGKEGRGTFFPPLSIPALLPAPLLCLSKLAQDWALVPCCFPLEPPTQAAFLPPSARSQGCRASRPAILQRVQQHRHGAP